MNNERRSDENDLVDWADVAALRDWLEAHYQEKRRDYLRWWAQEPVDLSEEAARIRARDEYARRDERERCALACEDAARGYNYCEQWSTANALAKRIRELVSTGTWGLTTKEKKR